MVAKLFTVPTFDVETFVQAVVKHCEESFDYDVRSNRAMGDFDKAEKFYKHALSIEFDAYAVLGLALMSNGRPRSPMRCNKRRSSAWWVRCLSASHTSRSS